MERLKINSSQWLKSKLFYSFNTCCFDGVSTKKTANTDKRISSFSVFNSRFSPISSLAEQYRPRLFALKTSGFHPILLMFQELCSSRLQ